MKRLIQLILILSLSVPAFAGVESTNKPSPKEEAVKELNVVLGNIPEYNLRELDSKTTRQREEYIDKAIYDIKTKWKRHSHRFCQTGKFTVSTQFTINNLGVLEDEKIMKGSGNKEFDKLVTDFVHSLSNYEKFSTNVNESFYNIPCDFTFKQRRDDYGVYVTQEMKYLNDDYRRYQLYMDKVSKLIDKVWDPTTTKVKETQCLKTVLNFNVHRKGDVTKVKILNKSESRKFDKSLVKFLTNLKFPIIPKEIDDKNLAMKYTFQYHCSDNNALTLN